MFLTLFLILAPQFSIPPQFEEMESNSSDNSCDSSRWEKITHVRPTPLLDPQIFNVDPENIEFCSSEGLESIVQEGMTHSLEENVQTPDSKLPQTIMEPQGLESVVAEGMQLNLQVEKDVQTPNPVSIQLPLNVHHPQVLLQFARIPKSRRGKGLIKSKIIGVSTISFDLIRLVDDPDAYILVMRDVESSCEVEEMLGVKDENRLPHPQLLKGWMKETRERPNGSRDKFYSHSTSARIFRSVVEVVSYIKNNNNLLDAELKNKSGNELQGYQGNGISEASSSSNDKKRKLYNSKDRLTFKKTREQVIIEEFFANAHQNLMNLSPQTPKAKEVQNQNAIQAFFAAAKESLIEGFQNENGDGKGNVNVNGNFESQSPEEVEDWINELLNR